MSRRTGFAKARVEGAWLVRQAWRAVVIASLALARPGEARAQSDTVLYAVNNTTTLYAVTNRVTGTTASIATLSFAAIAVARDPVSKRIYYVSGAAPIGRLAYYDPATGTSTVINSTGTAPNSILRLGYNTATGVLYALGDSARLSVLYTINTSTGVYTSLGSVRIGTTAGVVFPNSGDIAFNAAGTLYATTYADANNCNGNCNGTSATSLYTINLANRVATKIGDDFGPATTQTALSFVGATLYSAGADGSLFTLNTGTGAATQILASSAFAYQDFATGTPVADLQLGMAVSSPFTTGTNVTYTLTVTNAGPYPATGTITIKDTLPTGLTYSSGAGAGWACSAVLQVVTCTKAGPVASGAVMATVGIVATVTAVSGNVTNRAWVATASIDDQNQSNNVASVTSTVSVSSVSTTPDAATITRLPSNGVNYSQTFVVTNSGTLSDSYTLAATVAPAGVVTIVSVNAVAGTTGSTGTLASGATSNVVVVYSVATAAATGATAKLTLTATSTTVGTVSDPGDLTVTVARAGLTMTKALYRDNQTTLVTGPSNVATGEYVQYKITVSNSGGADAATVSVADVIPAQVTYVTATGDLVGWTFVKPAGTLTATLTGALTAGTSRFFWIRVQVK